MTTKQEIIKIEAELNLAVYLGREYFSDQSQALKLRLQELRSIEINKETKTFL